MKRAGFVLVEVLAASVLLAIAGTCVYTGFAQGMRMEKRIRETSALYDPLKLLWMQTEKDLRNTLPLRDYKFTGEQDELEFPAFQGSRLILVRYAVKDGELLRIEEALPRKFVQERPREKVLLDGVDRIDFQYAYLDEEERLVFKPVWLEDPYFGIPKAVRLDVKFKSRPTVFSRLVSLPQGRWGHVTTE